MRSPAQAVDRFAGRRAPADEGGSASSSESGPKATKRQTGSASATASSAGNGKAPRRSSARKGKRASGKGRASKNGKDAKARLTLLPAEVRERLRRVLCSMWGGVLVLLGALLVVALVTYSPRDPSLNTASQGLVRNALGLPGATLADLMIQSFGLASLVAVLALVSWGLRQMLARRIGWLWVRVLAVIAGAMLLAMAIAPIPTLSALPLPAGNGGFVGKLLDAHSQGALGHLLQGSLALNWVPPLVAFLVALPLLSWAVMIHWRKAGHGVMDLGRTARGAVANGVSVPSAGELLAGRGLLRRLQAALPHRSQTLQDALDDDGGRRQPSFESSPTGVATDSAAPPWDGTMGAEAGTAEPRSASSSPADSMAKPSRTIVTPPPPKVSKRDLEARQGSLLPEENDGFSLPSLDLLSLPSRAAGSSIDEAALDSNARMLEGVLADFGVKGKIVEVRPGPVVTLYELDPAPGTKTARVVGLADDIARSMSAVSVRIAVVPGKSTIGIELPNARREMVNFRELLASDSFHKTSMALALALGRDIGGAPVYVDLARMPHLLIAGTTGSGKSVAVNTMICSLLYRMTPDECRFIMVDPKMLELSVYDGIPHLLTPVVTDPGKAVVALKWAVKEMENRYRAMSAMGVRNIAGYNSRLRDALDKGQTLTRTVQTGFDPETGKPEYDEQDLDMTPLPFIVVIVDEMADLMLVAGKDVEAAIQRLAQMARAAGIHLIMATQRPSVDVITGTIKANFPTRISFQVTSKIDSRTILGEQGAEQLLGQGDMLYMAAGGRITRVHGPFASDGEVESIVGYLRDQGQPDYIEAVTDESEQGPSAILDALTGAGSGGEGGDSGDALFDQAVALVARERKASTSFVQRHLQIGYNRAARIIERMEEEGMVSKANHVGKREVLLPPMNDELL